jgi:hypothetical protein
MANVVEDDGWRVRCCPNRPSWQPMKTHQNPSSTILFLPSPSCAGRLGDIVNGQKRFE